MRIDLIVILGPSGSGKTTAAEELAGSMGLDRGRLFKIVTYTTRPMRENEQQDRDYHFISAERFYELSEQGFWAEEMNYRGWYYGTALEDCRDPNAVIVMTPHGLRTLKRKGIPVFSVFLATDRRECLLRMLKRGDDMEEAYRRNLTDVGQFDGVEDETDLVIRQKYGTELLTKEQIADLIWRNWKVWCEDPEAPFLKA